MKYLNKVQILLVVSLLLIGNSFYASFPINSNVVNQQNGTSEVAASEVVDSDVRPGKKKSKIKSAIDNILNSPASAAGLSAMLILLLLWFFLGWPFAAHRWFAGRSIGWTILFILTFGGLGLWLLVDLVLILMGNFKS